VRATAKLDFLDGGATPDGAWHDVMELEEAARAASVSVLGNERAATRVARGDLAAHRRGYGI